MVIANGIALACQDEYPDRLILAFSLLDFSW
jgi:hypothetical protein